MPSIISRQLSFQVANCPRLTAACVYALQISWFFMPRSVYIYTLTTLIQKLLFYILHAYTFANYTLYLCNYAHVGLHNRNRTLKRRIMFGLDKHIHTYNNHTRTIRFAREQKIHKGSKKSKLKKIPSITVHLCAIAA